VRGSAMRQVAAISLTTCFYAFVHPVVGAGNIMCLGCPSACECRPLLHCVPEKFTRVACRNSDIPEPILIILVLVASNNTE